MNNTVKNTPSDKVFYFKQEWFDVLSEMSAKVRLQVYEAVMMYQATGMVPEEMTKVARMAFYFIRKEIDQMNGVTAGLGESDSTTPADQKHDERNTSCKAELHSHVPRNTFPDVSPRKTVFAGTHHGSATVNTRNSDTTPAAIGKYCV